MQGKSDQSNNREGRVSNLSLPQVIKEIWAQFSRLMRKEIELAKTELRADIRSEVAMLSGLGIAAVLVLLTISMLLVTLILALSEILPGWAAGLIVSGVLLLLSAIVAIISWRKLVKVPLKRTREVLEGDIKFTRGRFA
ncbi:MAG TPA: phage holin family protein [Chitinispirillaceae bacterium]|jgi:uncharacterized membrane protein YqjE|nr:phage holin family protein [Chitinispirillaceae bacterium]